MKKVIAWLLVLALTAAVSIGATLAYLTDTDEDVNVMTLGKVKIDQLEYERVDVESKDDKAEVQEFHDNKPLYPAVTEEGFGYTPGDTYVDWEQIGKDGYTSDIWDPEKINNEVDKMVFVKNKGDYDAYVRSVFAFEAGNYKTLDEFKQMVHLNLNETDWTWDWLSDPVKIGESTYFVATATYNKVLAPGALTEISLSQIALDKTATNADVEAFGDTYQVLVKSQGIQADGFDTAAFALDEGFGVITANNIPWKNDAPTKGIDVRTALHYLDGDKTTTAITANVSSVTFGLNKNYTSIVDGNTGTLVDVEQDVPVYAYYVKNGSNYDVYFLADDAIYSPKDSSSLYQGMSALTTVNTANYDVSRVETMQKMFRECPKLTTLDTTDWDTSHVTDMSQVFYQCKALQSIPGIESWETGASTTMRGMFRECGVKGDLDLTGWDVSNVTDMVQMFYKAINLASFDAEGWDAGACTDMSVMFRECSKLTTLNVSGWDTGKLVNASQFALACSNLQTVDTTGWTLGSLENASYMFFNCGNLIEVLGTGTWDLSNVTTTYSMFEYAYKLASLDVTNWGLSSLTNAKFMFDQCKAMTTLTGEENWTLDNLVDATQMFTNCNALTALDSEGWGMGKAELLYLAFGNCNNLEYIETGSWDTGSFVDLTGTFQHCYKLKTVDVANWDTSNVTSMWGTFNASNSLEELDVSNWDVRKVTNFTMMFQGRDSNAMDMKIKKLDVSKWEPVSAERMGHMFYGCAQLTELDLSGWNTPNLYTTSHMFADCINLEVIDVSGWQTGEKWLSMDAMFNDCRKVKFLDVSCFTTSGVTEFSQIFEACWALEEIKGLENWNTSNGKSFDQTFMTCSSLKELNLSSFDTRNAMYGNKHLNGDTSHGFDSTFNGCSSLQKLTLGANFDFDGNGTVTHKATLPNPAAIDGQATKWYNAANDTYYTAAEIPQPNGATVTYVAAVPPANP